MFKIKLKIIASMGQVITRTPTSLNTLRSAEFHTTSINLITFFSLRFFHESFERTQIQVHRTR